MRRPDQLSMLRLMGARKLESAKHPFEGFKMSAMKVDVAGNVLEVTVHGPSSPGFEEAADEDPWWDQPAWPEPRLAEEDNDDG